MIHVLTPIRKGEVCADDLSTQSVECKRFTMHNDIADRRANEAYNRAELKQHASRPYTVLMDADVILDNPHTIERMMHVLVHSRLPAVAVDTKSRNDTALARDSAVGHTVIACMMIRSIWLDPLMFAPLEPEDVDCDVKDLLICQELGGSQKCLCRLVNAQIRTMTGYPIPYLRNVRARET